MKVLICIGGPTGSGKTSLAISLAKMLDTGIISFDSRQIYRELNIGVARPTSEQLNSVEHFMIGTVSIQQHYNAGDFEREGTVILKQLFKDKEYVVAVGGTGLYIKALTEGFDEMPEIKQESSDWVEENYRQNGLPWLQKFIRETDEDYALEADMNNPVRLLRAAKVIKSSGRKFSDFRKGIIRANDFRVLNFALCPDRQILYERINRRVDEMMNDGLLTEVSSLFPFRNFKALQTVGYAELFKMLDGEIALDQAVDLIKQNTRRYAKRQVTWFKNQGSWLQLYTIEEKENLELIKQHLYDLENGSDH